MTFRWKDLKQRKSVQLTSRHFSQWTTVPQYWFITCCDCGLTHEYRFSWRRHKGKMILHKRCRIHQGATKLERERRIGTNRTKAGRIRLARS